MESSRRRNMGWGLSLVILCVAVLLAPRAHAYWGGQDDTGEYGTVIGIVSLPPLIYLDYFRVTDADSSSLYLLGHR